MAVLARRPICRLGGLVNRGAFGFADTHARLTHTADNKAKAHQLRLLQAERL